MSAITQVVLDLLDNAAEAMEELGGGSIRLSLTHDEKYISFNVVMTTDQVFPRRSLST